MPYQKNVLSSWFLALAVIYPYVCILYGQSASKTTHVMQNMQLLYLFLVPLYCCKNCNEPTLYTLCIILFYVYRSKHVKIHHYWFMNKPDTLLIVIFTLLNKHDIETYWILLKTICVWGECKGCVCVAVELCIYSVY